MAAKDDRSEFEAFVKRQQQISGESVDWNRRRDEWLHSLDELYKMIEVFLTNYIASGTIKLDYNEIFLNEENIGSYAARQMVLKIGPQEIILKPVGTLLIGARGRVDVIGPAGRTRFVLVNQDDSRPNIRITTIVNDQSDDSKANETLKPISWAWKIATTPPRIEYIELTEESLYRAVMEVVNG